MYLYAIWMLALKNNKSRLPPNFQTSIDETMDCVERVLRRRELRRIIDIRIGFDAETQQLTAIKIKNN